MGLIADGWLHRTSLEHRAGLRMVTILPFNLGLLRLVATLWRQTAAAFSQPNLRTDAFSIARNLKYQAYGGCHYRVVARKPALWINRVPLREVRRAGIDPQNRHGFNTLAPA